MAHNKSLLDCYSVIFANRVNGLTKSVVIDTGIFNHQLNDSNLEDDLVMIYGSIISPITIGKVLDAFDEIEKRFKYVSNNRYANKPYINNGFVRIASDYYKFYWN